MQTREFAMTEADFAAIARLALEHTGIVLAEHKKDMVYGRIARRIRARRLSSFTQYIDYLSRHLQDEISEFINALTTNLTSFYRESHHFDFLQRRWLPELLTQSTRKRLRVWSAGCSIGQEVYSIAMALKEGGIPHSWDCKLLATDLDSNVLETGRAARYPIAALENLPAGLEKRYFERINTKEVQVIPALRNMVFFKRLNLLGAWPMTGPFDAIFCRNVVIYFNKDTQRQLFDRMADMLPLGGHLFIGHSENLHGITGRFEPLGQTIYRKIH
ncbi:chemotaxis protein methyltransferase [Bacterioplanes sanyensis]|uniref:CheR family methyltransferase n=1 Tax=Bacterioplanes sanyensis TaxID=1249553 RepID=UPI0019C9753D|nr:protein-glutamate O-methyltransferase CheR [Bacterioplanes sanyensis]GGY39650.1 chemotaxis protein methyltransferase [Bacterioplanes sanyensis]